jgi:formiminotetrahydrofolate cyclodeaminase
LSEFADELSMDSPAPGGGSTAALCGSLAAALCSMVCNLTVGKKEYDEVQDTVKELAERGQGLKGHLLRAIDMDTEAFNRVMDCFRMPRKTETQKTERAEAIEEATKEATRIPLDVLEKSLEALQLAEKVVLQGNKNSLSDAGVAALAAQAGVEGAYYNVLINLPGIEDKSFRDEMRKRAGSLKENALTLGEAIRARMEQELKGE